MLVRLVCASGFATYIEHRPARNPNCILAEGREAQSINFSLSQVDSLNFLCKRSEQEIVVALRVNGISGDTLANASRIIKGKKPEVFREGNNCQQVKPDWFEVMSTNLVLDAQDRSR
jgi:hypothetical protein